MQAISCIFCNTQSNHVAIQENGYQGKQCFTCSVIYISPRPSAQQIANLYGHDQAYLSAHTHITQSYAKQLHAKHTLKIIKKYLSHGTLLEVGCGAGYFLDQARKAGYAPAGIELNPVQAAFIQSRLQLPCSSDELSPSSFGNQKFDVIYHCDVASHFYDPIEAFKTMHSKLNSGGFLIFETGNIADIKPEYLKAFKKFQYPDHLFFFGTKSIAQLLERTGFTHLHTYKYAITNQLYFNKLVSKLKPPTNKTQTAQSQQPSTQNTDIKKIVAAHIQKLYHYSMHTLRYSVGRYTWQEKKPQTLIVVAQKQ